MVPEPPDFTDDDLKKRIEAFKKVIQHITTQHGKYVRGQSKDVAGTMTCPLCGSDLRYRRAAYNGHHHAFCTKAGCLQIMQ